MPRKPNIAAVTAAAADHAANIAKGGSAPKGRNTVTVACKLPHGLVLRVFGDMTVNRPTPGGGVTPERVAQQIGDAFTIKGNAFNMGEERPRAEKIGGFAITYGVPADLWHKWLEQNKDADVVKNGLIFAHEKTDTVAGKAKDGKALKSGLERIDVSPNSKDPRVSKGLKKYDPDDMGDGAEAAA